MKYEPYTEKELLELLASDLGSHHFQPGRVLATFRKLMADGDQTHAMACDAHERVDALRSQIGKIADLAPKQEGVPSGA